MHLGGKFTKCTRRCGSHEGSDVLWSERQQMIKVTKTNAIRTAVGFSAGRVPKKIAQADNISGFAFSNILQTRQARLVRMIWWTGRGSARSSNSEICSNSRGIPSIRPTPTTFRAVATCAPDKNRVRPRTEPALSHRTRARIASEQKNPEPFRRCDCRWDSPAPANGSHR